MVEDADATTPGYPGNLLFEGLYASPAYRAGSLQYYNLLLLKAQVFIHHVIQLLGHDKCSENDENGNPELHNDQNAF